MAKVCGNCGASISDSAVFCGSCGAPVETAASKKGPNVKLIVIIAVIVAVIAAAAVGIIYAVNNAGGSGGDKDDDKADSYEDVARSYIEALVAEDWDKAAKLFSEVMMDYEDVDEKDVADSLEITFKSRMEYVEDRVGKKVKVRKIEFTDIDKYDKDDLEDFIDELDDSGVYDPDKIKGVVEVEALVNLKGSKKDRDYEMNFLMVKESGKWKIFTAFGPYED